MEHAPPQKSRREDRCRVVADFFQLRLERELNELLHSSHGLDELITKKCFRHPILTNYSTTSFSCTFRTKALANVTQTIARHMAALESVDAYVTSTGDWFYVAGPIITSRGY